MPEKPPQPADEPSFEGPGKARPQGDVRKPNARYRGYNPRSKRHYHNNSLLCTKLGTVLAFSMRPVELGELLVSGTGLTLIRKRLKRSFVLLRVVSYKDVPRKEQAWFGLNYCSYAVRDKRGAEYMIIANNRQPQNDDYKPWFLWRNSRKGKGPEKSRFDTLLASVDAGDTGTA